MIKKNILVTGLDIGSSKIAAVAAEVQRDGALNLLAQITGPSKGVSRGVPVNLNDAVSSIASVLEKLSAKISRRPENIYVNISGQDLRGVKSRGMIPLSLRGREIIAPDMDRCINAASTINLPFDREIIHRVVNSFAIDDQPWIKNPLGLFASRLNCEVFVISADINHIQNIYKCVNSAGHDITELVFTGIAEAACYLPEKPNEEYTVIVDIGSTLTELSAFFGGSLFDFEIIPVGADDIKGAPRDSDEFNNLMLRIVSRAQSFKISGGEISKVILTGGFSFKDEVVESVEEKVPYPVEMGVIKQMRGDITALEAVRSAGAVGLCKYARQKYIRKTVSEGSPIRRLSTKVVDIFNNYF